MAAMAALQSSFTTLSISNNSFFGQRLFISPTISQEKQQLWEENCSQRIEFDILRIRRNVERVKTTERSPCLVVARLKHWERKDCKPNSLPIVHKMHVKIGDTVKVISGKEKGKIGEVSKLYKLNSTIIIKDINLKTKHVKPKGESEPGQIIKIEGPIHSSNVMLYSKEKEVVSRVGHKVLDDGSKVRYLIKTGEVIDSAEKWKEVMKNKTETAIEVAA